MRQRLNRLRRIKWLMSKNSLLTYFWYCINQETKHWYRQHISELISALFINLSQSLWHDTHKVSPNLSTHMQTKENGINQGQEAVWFECKVASWGVTACEPVISHKLGGGTLRDLKAERSLIKTWALR